MRPPLADSTHEDSVQMSGLALTCILKPESDPAALSEPIQVEVISSLWKYHFCPLASDVRFFSLLLCLRDDLVPFTREPGEEPGAPQVKKMKGYAATCDVENPIQMNHQNRA